MSGYINFIDFARRHQINIMLQLMVNCVTMYQICYVHTTLCKNIRWSEKESHKWYKLKQSPPNTTGIRDSRVSINQLWEEVVDLRIITGHKSKSMEELWGGGRGSGIVLIGVT